MDIKGMHVIEAGHVTEVYGPVQALRNYLQQQDCTFTFISHPFSYTGLEGTKAEVYENGVLKTTKKGHKKSVNLLIQWTKDFFFNLGYGFKNKCDFFMAVDNLNGLSAVVLKLFGRAQKTGYYVIDHMDRRFKNPVFNFFYETLDYICLKYSDTVWILSERMAEAKKKKFKLKGDNFQIVPVGIELDKVDKFSESEKLKEKTMVLMSYLDETKGVQLMIDAMGSILKEVPDAQLLIIGTGPYENALKEQAKRLKLENSVKFLGLMNHSELFKYIPHRRISIAPYIDDKNNYTWYADPTKPKEYLACGLPMVITNVPWVAEEVRRRPMGVVCAYNKEELAAACVKLLKDDAFYSVCLKNALDFTSELSWESIYGKALNGIKG